MLWVGQKLEQRKYPSLGSCTEHAPLKELHADRKTFCKHHATAKKLLERTGFHNSRKRSANKP